MQYSKGNDGQSKELAVAIDKGKSSRAALKWALEQLYTKGQTVTLIHVRINAGLDDSVVDWRFKIGGASRGSHIGGGHINDHIVKAYKKQFEDEADELFQPFRCYCKRKNVQCKAVILDEMSETDIAKAVVSYISDSLVETLVVGSTSKISFVRQFKGPDIANVVAKDAPDFCNVYVICNGKISHARSASSVVPAISPKAMQFHDQSLAKPAKQLEQTSFSRGPTGTLLMHMNSSRALEKTPFRPRKLTESTECSSPITSNSRSSMFRSYGDNSSIWESDTCYSSSISSKGLGKSSNYQVMFPSHNTDSSDTRSSSSSLEYSYSPTSVDRSAEVMSSWGSSSSSSGSSHTTSTSELEAEMRRLKLELKQSITKYSVACKEADLAKQNTTMEVDNQKREEDWRVETSRPSQEPTLAIVEKEKVRRKGSTEASNTNIGAPPKWMPEAKMKMSIMEVVLVNYQGDESSEKAGGEIEEPAVGLKYRRYTLGEMEEATDFFSVSHKIGEGGYGPVYKGCLDHTPVAIKVLRPDAAHGRSQFQKEVEVLSCMRHPNMVLLLGACPENGCLVYEFMANGSLEDRLFRKGNTAPLPLHLRFRIASEIATCLLFLHQTKPEPLVHRDLKPANILLDQNYVSKISDVGLARIVPPSIADQVTQYHITSAAGTFCYIDPEYQQTCMLGTKSDVYSLGIMLLQIITAKPPMGLAHQVEMAIENGSFAKILDPNVPDWPIQEALSFATLALKCAELRKRDRPDLRQVVPELNRLRALVEENLPAMVFPTNKYVHL